ncbi:J domain-containing protein [Chloroflexota bacterium]
MIEQAKIPKWTSPKTIKLSSQRAKDRANAARWDLDVAIFLFAVLIIIIILLYQGIGIIIVAPVAILGLSMVWLVGWRRAKQVYEHLYEEELSRHDDEWKDYYKILRMHPTLKFEVISEAYERLSTIYHKALSDDEKRTPMHSLMTRELEEAYQVLSDPITRNAYDHIFWIRHNAEKTDVEESAKEEVISLAETTVQEVLETKQQVNISIPRLTTRAQRAILVTVSSLFLVLLMGTSVAFAEPEHALAAPFKGIASTMIKTSSGAINLIEFIREEVAIYERNVVSIALQSMRVTEHMDIVPEVRASTNDMAKFPSQKYPLFPEYLDKRYSQFKYTVNSQGIISVDTSSATTDTLLENITNILKSN